MEAGWREEWGMCSQAQGFFWSNTDVLKVGNMLKPAEFKRVNIMVYGFYFKQWK